MALRRLGLDRVWWLVTPGNPLKDHGELAPLGGAGRRRRERRRRPSAHRRDRFRGRRSARATPSTRSRYLKRRCPGVRLRLDHGGRQPRQLPPLAGLARIAAMMPHRGHRSAGLDPAGRPHRGPPRRCRVRRGAGGREAARSPTLPPPAWIFLHGPRSTLSSTELRRRRSELLRTAGPLKNQAHSALSWRWQRA